MTISFTTGECVTDIVDDAIRNYQLQKRRQLRNGDMTEKDALEILNAFDTATQLARQEIGGDA